MHSLRVTITPPRPGIAQSILTPNAYLLSGEMMETLHSKNLINNQEEQSSLLLHPEPVRTNYSIGTYYQRVSQLLPNDREKLAVLMPMTNCKESIEVSNQFTSHSLISLFTNY